MEPASIRYKNPGAMWGGAHAKKWGAINGGKGVALADGTGQGNTIAQFPTFVAGIAAQIALWRTPRYRNKPFKTAIIPWSGGNNVPSYIAFVAKRVPGFSGDTVIDDALLASPKGVAFLKAQAWHEAGRQYPASDAEFVEAQKMVFGATRTAVVVAKPVNKTEETIKTGAVVLTGGSAGAAIKHGVETGWGFAEWALLTIGLVALVALGIYAWRWWQRRQAENPSVTPAAEINAAAKVKLVKPAAARKAIAKKVTTTRKPKTKKMAA